MVRSRGDTIAGRSARAAHAVTRGTRYEPTPGAQQRREAERATSDSDQIVSDMDFDSNIGTKPPMF